MKKFNNFKIYYICKDIVRGSIMKKNVIVMVLIGILLLSSFPLVSAQEKTLYLNFKYLVPYDNQKEGGRNLRNIVNQEF